MSEKSVFLCWCWEKVVYLRHITNKIKTYAINQESERYDCLPPAER